MNFPALSAFCRHTARISSAVGLSALVVLFALGGRAAPTVALSNGLALTPPMGWNSWYSFGCNVNEDIVRSAAYAMNTNGMQKAGYTYVNIDDCWEASSRNADGALTSNTTKFPSGMPALANYVHGLGLKLGIYTDAGTATCQGFPGSYGHYAQDALTFAQWGVDFIKVDWCNTTGLDPKTQYSQFRDAIANVATTRPMVFSICDWGVNSPWVWGPSTGNMWRMSSDIPDRWTGFLRVVDKNAPLYPYAGPGAWNDPDMLQVGRNGMTDTEYRSQFSLWTIMAAPLLAGNDIGSMLPNSYTAATLTNTEVIAVNQDPLGIQGRMVSQNPSGDLQVWAKPLGAQSGSAVRAVVLFNRQHIQNYITVNWSDVGLTPGSITALRDLWAHQDLNSSQYTQTSYRVAVPSHAVVVLRVVGQAP